MNTHSLSGAQILLGGLLAIAIVAIGLAVEEFFARRQRDGILPIWLDASIWIGVLLAIFSECVAVVAL